MVYIVMAYNVMAYIVMAYMVMAYEDIAWFVMALSRPHRSTTCSLRRAAATSHNYIGHN